MGSGIEVVLAATLVAAAVGLGLRRGRAHRDLTPLVDRPLEEIAFELRRMRAHMLALPDGSSYVKVTARTLAYDRCLHRACTALGVVDLLLVLPPGSDHDRERVRVERELHIRGLVIGL